LFKPGSLARFETQFGLCWEKMHEFLVFLFAIAAGITASGLTANIYGLLGGEPTTRLSTVIHYAVMIVAGPVVLAANSTRSFRQKECSRAAYALALVFSGYWSFAMGLFILSVAVGLRHA
jgi:hypothetical protein